MKLPNFMAKRPQIIENDFSGVVVDANGSNFSNGDNVYGWMTLREYVITLGNSPTLTRFLPLPNHGNHQRDNQRLVKEL